MKKPIMTKSLKENLQLIGIAAVLILLGGILVGIGRNPYHSSEFLIFVFQFALMMCFGIGGIGLLIIGFSLLPNAVYFLFKELLFSSYLADQE